MAKISMFLGFFLLALIAMPATSSASRMILQDNRVDTCPEVFCAAVCPQIRCRNGVYTPCCDCPKCCPPA
ncbi:hypothetical protein MKW94_016675 [Papaver nudicaule]|uniref:Uncharacterized protein n=1 Tax=Papaver nudicaule TaxID=74823 RepID=A0AA41UXZ6_PAPNU|nr:hypothetical protein [Papaver nudicaule]